MRFSYAELSREYLELWRAMRIAAGRLATIDRIIAKILAGRPAYAAVEAATSVPWPVVATFHNLEAGLDFTAHLHNGDPLTGRTVQVPKGRPVAGSPPFAWQASAIDALTFKGLAANRNWTVQGTAYALESYNGWGYRRYHPEVKSPYLWGFSSHYAGGKYARDGRWDQALVSGQCGGMVLLKRLQEKGLAVLAEDAIA